jgi:hypothetical protein
MNEIRNALVMPIEDPASNNIMHIALEVHNMGGHQKKTKTPFNCVLVFHFQKAQRQFRQIVARCGCQECVVEDVYHMVPAGYDFGVGSSYGAGMSYAAGTSSTGAANDDDDVDLGLDLDTTADVLSQLEDPPDLTQPSQALQGVRARNPPHRFTLGSSTVVQRKRGRHH